MSQRSRRAVLPAPEPIETIAFWIAIAMPALYVPLLVRGLDSPEAVIAFLLLVGANVLSLAIGRGHGIE